MLSHQQAEARDAGEGGGQGGAGQRELAKVAYEHDGDHLDRVLQEEPKDERPGEVQLLLDLPHCRALLLGSFVLLSGARRCGEAEERLLHARLRDGSN
jgi:hypothetical protein